MVAMVSITMKHMAFSFPCYRKQVLPDFVNTRLEHTGFTCYMYFFLVNEFCLGLPLPGVHAHFVHSLGYRHAFSFDWRQVLNEAQGDEHPIA